MFYKKESINIIILNYTQNRLSAYYCDYIFQFVTQGLCAVYKLSLTSEDVTAA